MPTPRLRHRTLDQLRIEDERAFRSIPHYARLKELLRRARYPFRCLPAASLGRWDRALLLNLNFWGGDGGDVLEGESIAADVVTHAAWHHMARRAFEAIGEAGSADALLFGEACASAYDVYLVGRLLAGSGRSSFLRTQVGAMSEAASAAGVSAGEMRALLGDIAADPEAAFEDLRALLFTASTSLLAARDADAALGVLERLGSHRFAGLLHHYELSSWVLYCRAYAPTALGPVPAIRALHRRLRGSPSAVDALMTAWCTPLLESA